MAKIFNPADPSKETSETAALRQYFGLRTWDTPPQTLSGFLAEIKQLTPADKTELAHGAAKELGWTVQA